MKLGRSSPWRSRSASHSTRLHVRFVPRHRFEVLGIDQQQRAPLLQHVKDGAPENTSTLQGHMGDRMETQPVIQG